MRSDADVSGVTCRSPMRLGAIAHATTTDISRMPAKVTTAIIACRPIALGRSLPTMLVKRSATTSGTTVIRTALIQSAPSGAIAWRTAIVRVLPETPAMTPMPNPASSANSTRLTRCRDAMRYLDALFGGLLLRGGLGLFGGLRRLLGLGLYGCLRLLDAGLLYNGPLALRARGGLGDCGPGGWHWLNHGHQLRRRKRIRPWTSSLSSQLRVSQQLGKRLLRLGHQRRVRQATLLHRALLFEPIDRLCGRTVHC